MEIAAASIVELALKYGVPLAVQLIDSIFSNVNANGAVGLDEWAKMRVSLNKTATDITLDVMKSKGIDATTPDALAVLALTK